MTYRPDSCDKCICQHCSKECTTCEDWDQDMVCGCPAKECHYLDAK